MNCSTKKNQYYTEAEAAEALIRSHIRFNKPALSYYLCVECAQFPLTSQGEKHPLLQKHEVVERIKKEQQSQDWSNWLRSK